MLMDMVLIFCSVSSGSESVNQELYASGYIELLPVLLQVKMPQIIVNAMQTMGNFLGSNPKKFYHLLDRADFQTAIENFLLKNGNILVQTEACRWLAFLMSNYCIGNDRVPNIVSLNFSFLTIQMLSKSAEILIN
jgi:hypothetical protein